MARLINDSGVLGKKIKVEAKTVNSVSFDKIIEAIGVMQDRMGITGTTAKEAGATIAGSVGAMKSAWTNLITGLADGNADIGKLIDNLVTTIVGDGTESNLGVLGNVMPAVKRALNGASKLVQGLLPKIVQEIPSIINDNLPVLAEASISIVQSLVDGISQNQKMLIGTVFGVVMFLATSLLSMLPQIVKLGPDIIISLANGLSKSLPKLIPTIISVVLQIVDTLTNPDTLQNLIDAAFAIIEELALGIGDALPRLTSAITMIIDRIVSVLLKPENLANLVRAAFNIIVAIGGGLISSTPELLKSVVRLTSTLIAQFKDADWAGIGKDLVAGFKRGIQNAWSNLKKWFRNLFGDLIGIAKKILGIASPSKVFKKLGSWTADGFGIGFEDEFAHIKDDMEDALNFDDASVGINASVRKIGAGAVGGAFGGTSIGNITINIDGAKYSNEQSLAEAVAEAIQRMTDRRAAVYA